MLELNRWDASGPPCLMGHWVEAYKTLWNKECGIITVMRSSMSVVCQLKRQRRTRKLTKSGVKRPETFLDFTTAKSIADDSKVYAMQNVRLLSQTFCITQTFYGSQID